MSEDQKTDKEIRAVTLTKGCIGEKNYDIDDKFRPGEMTFHGVHTVAEVAKLLESDEKIEFEGIFLAANPKDGKIGAVRLNKAQFLEKWKKNAKKTSAKKYLEGFNGGGWDWQTGANLIGDDYTPLMGGPFNKQLYLHDMLRMMALTFHASNHDPIAKAIIDITVNFTLGRGYRLDSKNKRALAVWRAFEKANKLPEIMRHIATGLCRDGEVMLRWLPQGQKYMLWQDTDEQIPDPVVLPRIKLADPSTCWEVITFPEDIDRVVAYQFVYPTQYNIYTAESGGTNLPSSKFIFQQVPAEEMMHFRVNRSPNEKRGRSDFYAALGFMKRLRDTVEYSIVGLAKAAAWALDTEIDGSPTDVTNYVADQQSQKSIAPAGSEFVHSPKIKRTYLSNSHASASGGSVSAFEWCLNMICASVGIPVSYLGTHLSGGQTKASAMVGTEPVTKKFEARQLVYEDILRSIWNYVMNWAEVTNQDGSPAECEITFPELIAQDRSAKIKDLITAQEVDAIDHEYMSTSIAQELGYNSYDYGTIQAKIAKEREAGQDKATDTLLISPLTARPAVPSGGDSGSPAPDAKPSAVTKQDRRAQTMNDRQSAGGKSGTAQPKRPAGSSGEKR